MDGRTPSYAELLAENAALRVQVAGLEQQVATLERQVATLTAQVEKLTKLLEEKTRSGNPIGSARSSPGLERRRGLSLKRPMKKLDARSSMRPPTTSGDPVVSGSERRECLPL